MAATTEELIVQQDQLRTVRQFVSLLSGVAGQEQTLSGTDFAPVNASGQFTTVGPYGQSVEGQPILTYSPSMGVTAAPVLVLAGLAVAAYFLLK
jgi:hypothetical protein